MTTGCGNRATTPVGATDNRPATALGSSGNCAATAVGSSGNRAATPGRAARNLGTTTSANTPSATIPASSAATTSHGRLITGILGRGDGQPRDPDPEARTRRPFRSARMCPGTACRPCRWKIIVVSATGISRVKHQVVAELAFPVGHVDAEHPPPGGCGVQVRAGGGPGVRAHPRRSRNRSRSPAVRASPRPARQTSSRASSTPAAVEAGSAAETPARWPVAISPGERGLRAQRCEQHECPRRFQSSPPPRVPCPLLLLLE